MRLIALAQARVRHLGALRVAQTWLLVLFLSSLCSAQVINGVALQRITSSNYVRALPTANVATCLVTDNATPCTHYVTAYTDSTLSVACVTLGTPVSGPNCSNPGLADADGNYTVFVPAGLYTVCVSSGTSLNCYKASTGGGTGCTAGCVLLTPSTDQTIATGHQLINRGTEQVGPAISTFDANIQGQAFDPASGTVATSGQNKNASTTSGFSAGVQGIAQGFSALAFWGLASNTVTNTVDFPNAGDFQSFLTCTLSCAGGPMGSAAAGLAFPAVGTTMGLASGFRGQSSNFGLGTVTTMNGFEARNNTNTGGGAVTNNYGFNQAVAQTVGTTNAAFHTVNQGSGASTYAFYSEGGRFRVDSTPVPATAASAGTAGEVAWDSGFIYICISANTWKRVAIATW